MGIENAAAGRRADSLHLMCVLGTRPEAIKLAPVVLAARAPSSRVTVTIVATGQHRDLASAALADFDLTADVDLNVMQNDQRPMDVLGRIALALPAVLEERRPDILLVQGDTTSALAGALAAHHAQIPVGHVEAGLRTDDRYAPFPEEMNRRVVSVVATWHFAPTTRARDRLRGEGIRADDILVTGNTVVDALQILRRRARPPEGAARLGARRLVLLTCHRRENHGPRLVDICAAVRTIVRARPDVAVLCPVHPNPAVEARVQAELGGMSQVVLVAALPYPELLWAMERAAVVLTDSGGLQEEAPAFGAPVLVLRDVTERPEGLAAGVARLVGTAPDTIVRETLRLLDDDRERAKMMAGGNPYGDGRAAGRILAFLAARSGLAGAPSGDTATLAWR